MITSTENTIPERERYTETHDNEIFAEFYPELSPKFLDYEKARTIFKDIVHMRDRCIEIGMGSGSFALPLIREGYQIDGLEPGKHMLNILRENLLSHEGYQPLIVEKEIQDHDFQDGHDFIISHSGPIFFVNDHGSLFLEGLRDDQIGGANPRDFHEHLLRKLLVATTNKSGSLMVNIQEDRTDIPLKNGEVIFKYERVGSYDLDQMSVVKYGRFINMRTDALMQPKDEKSQFRPYKRFACSLPQLQEFFEKIGDISVEIRDDIWLLIKPNSI